MRFDNLFTFIYSKREGTVAAKIDDKVRMEEKKRRFQQLLTVQNRIANEQNALLLGQTMTVLVDGVGQDEEYPLTARTQGQKLLRLKGAGEGRIGQFVQAKVTKHTTWSLFGEIQD